MKPKHKFNISAKVLLIICVVFCFIMIFVSFKYQDRISPIKTYTENLIQPMQSGVNKIGRSIYGFFDLFDSKQKLIEENSRLKKELQDAVHENVSLIEDKNELESVLNSFLGFSKQEVPITSAISVDGKRLYQYQREGKEVELPIREIEVTTINLTAVHDDGFSFSCRGRGTIEPMLQKEATCSVPVC